jgi:hypothetical protein
MAYATSNPIKKISQAGDSNSIWFYSDGDAATTIAASGYFNSATADLKQHDVILNCSCCSKVNLLSVMLGWTNITHSTGIISLFPTLILPL